jgi:hypothetical protein
LVKQHLLPNSEGDGWRAAWDSECALQEGVTIRIPYDPDEINATTVSPIEPDDTPEDTVDPDDPVEASDPAAVADGTDGEVSAGSSTSGGVTSATGEGHVDAASDTSGAILPPPPNPLLPLDDRGSAQENPMPEGQDQEKSQELTAHEEVAPPDGLTGELTALAQSTGADPTLTIILALVAVLGGGTAWKFYRQNSEQKHDQKMAQMKMDAKAKGMEGQSPGPCQTVHAQLKTEVEELKSRLGQMDKKMALTADFDSDDVERKVRRLEKWRKSVEDDEEDDA